MEILILCSLPFTLAGTIDVGFPLKLYEILLPFLILFSLPEIIRAIMSRGPQGLIFKAMALIFLAGLFAAFVGLAQYRMGGRLATNVTRFPIEIASALRIGYLGMCVCCLVYFGALSKLRPAELMRYWCFGAIIASLYSLFLNISEYIGKPMWLFGQYYNQYGILGVVRQATFGEGNYAGTYFLLSFFIGVALFYLKRDWVGFNASVCAFLCLGVSQSSVAYIAFIITLPICAIILVRRKKKVWAAGIFVFVIFCSLIVLGNDELRVIIVEKLAGSGDMAYSRLDRLRFISAAWDMWQTHKLFGIGIGFYSSYFPLYVDDSIIGQAFQDGNVIVNNVYMEILAEGGLVMFLPFIFFLGSLGYFMYKNLSNVFFVILYSSYLGLLICLNAFPGFTLLFVWVFLAISVRSLGDPEIRQRGLHLFVRSRSAGPLIKERSVDFVSR